MYTERGVWSFMPRNALSQENRLRTRCVKTSKPHGKRQKMPRSSGLSVLGSSVPEGGRERDNNGWWRSTGDSVFSGDDDRTDFNRAMSSSACSFVPTRTHAALSSYTLTALFLLLETMANCTARSKMSERKSQVFEAESRARSRWRPHRRREIVSRINEPLSLKASIICKGARVTGQREKNNF